MLKLVDPVERKQELAQAVWRVIRWDGLGEASVRYVAREAGLSMGSLRHYFGTQAELMAFALRMVIDRIEGGAVVDRSDWAWTIYVVAGPRPRPSSRRSGPVL